MGADNIKEFTVQWVLFGLLFFCLLSFAITFTIDNNPNALGDSGEVFGNFQENLRSRLIETEDSGNAILNISSETNPEVSDLGSRDSVATSYGTISNARSFFNVSKVFLDWIIGGTAGKILVSTLGGLFALISAYFIYKSIRQGS